MSCFAFFFDVCKEKAAGQKLLKSSYNFNQLEGRKSPDERPWAYHCKGAITCLSEYCPRNAPPPTERTVSNDIMLASSHES